MSTLSQFAGGGVKSVQSGVASIASGLSTTVTITAVNTAKADVSILGQSLTTVTTADYFGRLSLTNSTTLTFTRGNANAYATTFSWQVVEYY